MLFLYFSVMKNLLSNFIRVIVRCVSKNILNIFDCNLKQEYPILIILGMNIPETTCH